MAGLNGYAQLRRGLLEHLPEMNGSDLKCYIALVLMANPRNGAVRITTRDLGETLGTGANRVSESIHRLEDAGYLEVERARNQHSITSIRITKWKRGGDTAAHPAVDNAVNTAVNESGQQADSKRTASGQHDGSDQRKPEYKSHDSHESHENSQEDDSLMAKSAEKYRAVNTLFESTFGRLANGLERNSLKALTHLSFTEERIREEFETARDRGIGAPMPYVMTCLTEVKAPTDPYEISEEDAHLLRIQRGY